MRRGKDLSSTFFISAVLPARSHPAPYVALSLVYFENIFYLAVKSGVHSPQSLAHVFMYRAFAYAEFFRGAAYGRSVFYYIFSKLDSSFLHDSLHNNQPPDDGLIIHLYVKTES